MRSVYDAIKPVFSVRPVAVTASTNHSSVDTKGYNSAMVVLEVGAVSGTTPINTVKIQESTDNSTFTDVSGATFTAVTASNNSQVLRVEGLGTSRARYLRAVSTVSGTTPSFTMSVEFLLGRAYSEPVN